MCGNWYFWEIGLVLFEIMYHSQAQLCLINNYLWLHFCVCEVIQYMKCFIYWTVNFKSSKPQSLQLWMQFKQLRREAWKSQDFNGDVELIGAAQTSIASFLPFLKENRATFLLVLYLLSVLVLLLSIHASFFRRF